MANNIPPSLKWLIDKRARLAGDINRTKKALSKVQHLINKLNTLEKSLASIDHSLKLHEIQVDVANIKPITPQVHQMKFPGGYISKYVIEYLISRIEDSPVPKSEIVNFLISKHYEYDDKPLPYPQATRAVSQALYKHFIKGRVVKYHPSVTRLEGKWGLSPEYIAIHSGSELHD